MGMFNYVKYKAKCIKCGEILEGWQTKDCDKDLTCEYIYPQECENFYDSCPKCHTWNEYEVIDKDTCQVKIVAQEELPDYMRIKE